MIEVIVDLDLLVGPSQAFGSVGGRMRLPSLPMTGDTVSLLFPAKDVVMPRVGGFSGFLTVKSRIFRPDNDLVIIGMEQVMVDSTLAAQCVMEYFKAGFDLETDLAE
jgi:hypothetical protein